MSEPDNMSKEEHAYWEGRAEEAGHIGPRRWTEEELREAWEHENAVPWYPLGASMMSRAKMAREDRAAPNPQENER